MCSRYIEEFDALFCRISQSCSDRSKETSKHQSAKLCDFFLILYECRAESNIEFLRESIEHHKGRYELCLVSKSKKFSTCLLDGSD